MTGPDIAAVPVQELAAACTVPPCAGGLRCIIERLAARLPGLDFTPVLSRGGWHRIGGVVDAAYGRIADQVETWAARESGGDLAALLDRYGDAGFFATRWQGTTHYLTAACGPGAADFVQLEVEELQEVLDRILIDPDWYPDDLQEFVDPLDYPRLVPEPVGTPRYAFRRLLRISDWVAERQASFGADGRLPRWFDDWTSSSAGAAAPLCRHWVLALRESADRGGLTRLTGKPVPAPGLALPRLAGGCQGATLANALHGFDKAAGYPFAWYFHMLCTTGVSSAVGDAVLADLAAGYTYLPERDTAVLQAWAADRYAL